MKSILTKSQKKKFTKKIDDTRTITVNLRYDDDCNNGHNSFSITGIIKDYGKTETCGCIHE